MKKNYFVFAALAGLLSLAACSGKPANEQAAEDAQKINADSLIPRLAAALADECSRNGINLACTTEKAKGFIKTYPPFIAVITEYDKKCPQNYGAKMCAQGYAAYLADNLAGRLEGLVSARAKESLKAKAETMRRAAEVEAKAKAAAEEAARKAKAAAEEAARKAEEVAKQAAEKAKAEAETAVKKTNEAAKTGDAHITAPAPAAQKTESPATPHNPANSAGQ